MVRLCPPFGWRIKGGFNLSSYAEDDCTPSNSSVKITPIDSNNVTYPPQQPSSEPVEVEVVYRNAKPSTSTEVPPTTNGATPAPSVSSKDDKLINNRAISDLVETAPIRSTDKVRRKEGVLSTMLIDSSQPIHEIKYQKYEKSEKSVNLIKKALMANQFLKNLMDDDRLNAVVEAMNPRKFTANSFIINEGETGSHFYVSAKGDFEVIKDEKSVKKFGPGEAFGELAILYKAKRFASVKVTTDAKVWVLERKVFQKIMLRSRKQEQQDNIQFLSSVDVLEGIQHSDLVKMSDFLKREFFLAGTKIVTQGEKGDKFYIIRGGTVSITKRPPNSNEEVFIKEISRGEYFGEQALLHEDRRMATVTAKAPGVECLTLDRPIFNEFLGNIKELKEKRHGESVPLVTTEPQIPTEFAHIKLDELEIIGTLGVGGFGRVELVQYTKDRSLTFALKCLKKVEVVKQQQQMHAFNEKRVMLTCNSPFICRLYNTYKDRKYVYFLMEPVLGGDVWTILQKKGYFNESTSRFMTACVVEAFEHLHSHDIIYRDLKPENLMLDSKGYVKLVDFGYAKTLRAGSKSYTFAGTPEYIAPELVLNKGHDRAIDYWALGVFIHELLVGKPPFRGTNHMKTYNLILRGIDAIDFNPRIPKVVQVLIRKLCRPVPTERLGYLKNGVKDIKNHRWFVGFDWDLLRDRQIVAPVKRPIVSNVDLSNFEEKFSKAKAPPDETSGWDDDF